jgi:hypothetical protein
MRITSLEKGSGHPSGAFFFGPTGAMMRGKFSMRGKT